MRNTSIVFILFFLFFYLYKKKIDKKGMEEKITTFMGNTTTSTISAAQKEMWRGGGRKWAFICISKDLARDNLKNWRPISLTNCDYKLLAKCLALHLGDVINDVASGDQVGCIKGHRVSMLLRLTPKSMINWMYGRNQDFCLRLIIVKLLTEYQRIFLCVWYMICTLKKKKKDLDLILRNGLVFLWQTPKAVLPTAVGYPNILP